MFPPSSAGVERGAGRREDLLLMDTAPTAAWGPSCITTSFIHVFIHGKVFLKSLLMCWHRREPWAVGSRRTDSGVWLFLTSFVSSWQPARWSQPWLPLVYIEIIHAYFEDYRKWYIDSAYFGVWHLTDHCHCCSCDHCCYCLGAPLVIQQWRTHLRTQEMLEVWVLSLGKDPTRTARPPTPAFLLGELHGQRSLEGCGPRGHRVRQDWAPDRSVRALL